MVLFFGLVFFRCPHPGNFSADALGAKQSTRCDGPTWWKTYKQNSFCVGVVWQTQSIIQHLVQAKKMKKSNR